MRKPLDRRLFVIFVSLLFASLACSAASGLLQRDAGGRSEEPPSALSQSSRSSGPGCGAAALAATRGQPGDPVEITGLPPGAPTAGYIASADFRDDETPTDVAIVETADGLSLLTPLHPTGIAGGEATLVMQADETVCFRTAFHVEAIERAPGSFDDYLVELGERLDLTRRLYGYNRSDLIEGDVSDLPAHLLPLALVERSLGSGPQPSDPEELLAWMAPEVTSTEPDRELLDALAGHFQLPEALRQSNELDRELLQQLSSSANVHRLSRQSPPYGFYEIYSAEALDVAMNKQRSCDTTGGPFTDKLAEDLYSGTQKVLETSFKKIPGTGSIIKAVMYREQLVKAACETLLPSELARLEAFPTIQWFPEDWTGPPGAVPKVRLVATSRGLDMREDLDRLTESAPDATRDMLFGLGEDLCGTHPACNASTLKIAAEEYPAVDVADEEWITVRRLSDAISLKSTRPFLYSPVKKGLSGIRFRTRDDRFGEAEPAQTEEIVNVAECLEEGPNPIETAYEADIEEFVMTCQTPQGTNLITSNPRTILIELTHLDQHGCMIQLEEPQGTFPAARIEAKPGVSVFEGVQTVDEASCGMTLTWSDTRRDILGEISCFGTVQTYLCEGSNSYLMEPVGE